MSDTVRILITGDRSDSIGFFPEHLDDGSKLEWRSIEVLGYERLDVSPDLVERLVQKPAEWAIFTSPRAIHFWTDVLLETGWDFPLETRVACIGEKTASVAEHAGLTPDFVPSEPGTEGFLKEFEPLLKRKPVMPSVFLPAAEGGRKTLGNRLEALGCEMIHVPLYSSHSLDDIPSRMNQEQFEGYSLVLFTSPSSVDALTEHFTITPKMKLAAIGEYTARHLQQRGYGTHKVLPGGDFARIAEVL